MKLEEKENGENGTISMSASFKVKTVKEIDVVGRVSNSEVSNAK